MRVIILAILLSSLAFGDLEQKGESRVHVSEGCWESPGHASGSANLPGQCSHPVRWGGSGRESGNKEKRNSETSHRCARLRVQTRRSSVRACYAVALRSVPAQLTRGGVRDLS